MSKNRAYCFTLNNYTDVAIEALATLDVKYLVYGHEVGESGTPHLQGYVLFNSPISFNSAMAKLRGAHVAVAKGTAQQNFDYCTKEGRLVVERGTKPKDPKDQGVVEKERWARILKAAEEGDSNWIRENEPQVYILHDKALERAAKRAKPIPQSLDTLDHEWWYGPTGTGKSRKARTENPNAFIKDPKERWWDGYAGQEVVIIDDFDKYQREQGGDMKRWLDHYPFQAPVKGGYMEIRPRKIIVTSNYHPGDIWDDEQTVNPIMRRVKVTDFDPNHFAIVSTNKLIASNFHLPPNLI